MIQIMLLWDKSNPDDEQMLERLLKGFNKMGCWKVELPPKDSIYKMLITVEKSNMEGAKGGKNQD